MSVIVVNPDRYIASEFSRLTRQAQKPLQPVTMRKRLKMAGLDPALARAPKPEIPAVTVDAQLAARIATQQWWTRMLIEMCESTPAAPICCTGAKVDSF